MRRAAAKGGLGENMTMKFRLRENRFVCVRKNVCMKIDNHVPPHAALILTRRCGYLIFQSLRCAIKVGVCKRDATMQLCVSYSDVATLAFLQRRSTSVSLLGTSIVWAPRHVSAAHLRDYCPRSGESSEILRASFRHEASWYCAPRNTRVRRSDQRSLAEKGNGGRISWTVPLWHVGG